MRIPELLFPLVAQGVLSEGQDPVLQFWHETLLIVFPPSSTSQLIYRPRADYVYLIFGMTMGRPRDLPTGTILTTDDYGFWHSHSQMRYHWDPAVESIYEHEYPHLLEATTDDPVIIDFYNNATSPVTGLPTSVIQDFSIWIFEFSKRHWPVYRQYMRGLYNLISSYGEKEPKEAKKSIFEQRDLLVEIRDLLKEMK